MANHPRDLLTPLAALVAAPIFLYAAGVHAQAAPPSGWGAPLPDPPPPETAAPADPAPDPAPNREGESLEPPPPPETPPSPVVPASPAGAPAGGEPASPGGEEPPAETDPLPALEEPDGPRVRHQFGFGSYGRVGAATDLSGSTARAVSVVAHAPRVVEAPYLETDLYYTLDPAGPWEITTVTTLGFTDDLFHYTGDWSSMLALRNLYAEFVWDDRVSVWAGSRSYRGDDIYLLDFWPLDNLNALGGGVGYRHDRLEVRWHMGVNRLRDDFTFQEADVPARLFGAERVVLMDRQRLVTSLGGSYRIWGTPGGPAIRLKAYFELHYLASGTYRREDRTDEALPSDVGWTGGLQLGSWGWGERASHANFFLRFSQGLAAYGEMGIPFGVNEEKRTWPRASELMIGLSLNYERGRFGVLGAAYLRRFVDADVEVFDEDDGWDFVLDVRPWIVVWGPLHLALDVSYQQRFPSGMSPTALEVLRPAVFQVAPMLVFAPLGPGSYERPQIRLVYRYAFLNDGALDTYALEDPRRLDPHVHYLGVQVEWWYNSSYR
jgi:maltoporin